jgi:DNA polymerase elongation subunit (family B)
MTKKELLARKKELLAKKRELGYEVERLNTQQMVIKILVNSCYGYMGNKNAPIGDDDIAASVTLTGQAVIKHSNECLKQFIREEVGAENISDHELEECIVYNDTDSLVYDTKVKINGNYISIGELYDKYAEDSDIDYSNCGHEVINVDDVSVATFHTVDGVNTTSKVRRLIRHKVSKRKFKIKVGDKEVIMTEDHGLMVKRGEDIIRISPKEIKKGDKAVIMT